MKSFLGGSVAVLAALLVLSFGSSSKPLAATALLAQQVSLQEQESKNTKPTVQQQEQDKTQTAENHAAKSNAAEANAMPLTAPQLYVATAYSRKGRGASGLGTRFGTIAADPRVLPFGTRVRLDAGQYSGEYVVTDSGTAIKGNKIDVWIPSFKEACRFGRRNVKLSVLSYGGKRRK